MTKPTGLLPTTNSARPKVEILAAAFLISAGVVFEWLEISYSHANVANLWYISLVLKTIWNMAECVLYTPALQEALRFSPLALLAAGFAMLWSVRRAASRTRNGELNG